VAIIKEAEPKKDEIKKITSVDELPQVPTGDETKDKEITALKKLL